MVLESNERCSRAVARGSTVCMILTLIILMGAVAFPSDPCNAAFTVSRGKNMNETASGISNIAYVRGCTSLFIISAFDIVFFTISN